MSALAQPNVANLGSERQDRSQPTPKRGIIWGLLILCCVFTVAPFIMVFILALSPAGAPTIPHRWPESFTLDNVTRVLSQRSFLRWTLNSVIYSFVAVGVVLLTSAMAAYAFARKRFPGKNLIFWTILATLMVPAQATIIPLFVLVAELGGVNTYWGLIVPTLANAHAVFLMRQFILGIPNELFEAARVDGAGEWTVFWRLVMPLTKPVMATLGIFVFLWNWNDFLWPLVIGQSEKMRTLTVGLAGMNAESVSNASLMAAAAISVIPSLIIFFLLQRYIVDSVTASGVKG